MPTVRDQVADRTQALALIRVRVRKKRGLTLQWTQQQLADKIQCEVKTVKRWESGKSAPSRRLAEDVADVFGYESNERDDFLGLCALGRAKGPRLQPDAVETRLSAYQLVGSQDFAARWEKIVADSESTVPKAKPDPERYRVEEAIAWSGDLLESAPQTALAVLEYVLSREGTLWQYLKHYLNGVKRLAEGKTDDVRDAYGLPSRTDAVRDWDAVSWPDVNAATIRFYEDLGVKDEIFSYPSATEDGIKVPLYVRDDWKSLQNVHLIPLWEEASYQDQGFELVPREKAFLELTPYLRRFRRRPIAAVGGGELFRLVKIDTDGGLALSFTQPVDFLEAYASQYFLEHELVTALADCGNPPDLPYRSEYAGSAEGILDFCTKRACRIGVSTLLLLRRPDFWQPIVGKRGKRSMSIAPSYDTMAGGVFDITTALPYDFRIQHKVLKEIAEELRNRKDLEKQMRMGQDPTEFYGENGLEQIRQIADNTVSGYKVYFQVTGFCIDLVRMVPEVTALVVVNDPFISEHFLNYAELNEEFQERNIVMKLPLSLGDVEEYFRTKMPKDPETYQTPFDPWRWTLPGAFTLYQGITRAAKEHFL
jgi:transcriptional regulator with XRE-family HTH domain